MRAISHFIVKKLNQVDFFAGGHLILKSQALTHLSCHIFALTNMLLYFPNNTSKVICLGNKH